MQEDSDVSFELKKRKESQAKNYNIEVKDGKYIFIKLEPSILFLKNDNYKDTISPCLAGSLIKKLRNIEIDQVKIILEQQRDIINTEVVECVKRLYDVELNKFDYVILSITDPDKKDIKTRGVEQ